jgi:Tol biopolymer transport system component
MKNILILLLTSILILAIQGVYAADYRLAGDLTKLVGNENRSFIQPIWSPDGLRIAFTTPGYRGIWVIDPDGKNMTQISDELGAGFGFGWSPDARAIVMRTAHYDGPFRNQAIKIYDFADQQTHILTEGTTRIVGLPRWTYDNSTVYFFKNNKLEMVPVETRSISKKPSSLVYSDSKNIFIQDESTDARKYWSPFKGKEILNLQVSPDGNKVSFEMLGGNLYAANIDGTELQDFGKGYRATWSPQSTHVIYMVTVDDGHDYLESDLYISRIMDGARIQLTNTPERIEMNPSWSPDGTRIAYDEYTEGAIYIVKIIPE